MKKRVMLTAVLAGAAAVSQAAITVINTSGTTDYDAGVYELLTGPSSSGGFSKSLGTGYLGQTFTTTNAFELGAITLLSSTDGSEAVTNLGLSVYEIDDPNAGSYSLPPSSTPLFSGTFDSPATGDANTLDTLYLWLGTNISLAADSFYMIVVDGTAASSDDFNWRRTGSSAGSVYDGGQAADNSSRDFLMGLGLTPVAAANSDEYILPIGVTSTNVAAPGVLANDLGYDSAVLMTNISSGSLTFNADGSFSCSGLVDGSNTFSYAVVSGSVTSTPARVLLYATLEATPPIAVDDTYVMNLAYGDHIEGNVLNNDTNTLATFEMFAMEDDYTVANGTLTVSTNDGAFFFTPAGGFIGTNTFTYRAYTEVSTSEVATVTLIVESNAVPGTLIDSFETYDNSDTTYIRDMADASLNWDTFGSGLSRVYDQGGYGPSYQYMEFGYASGYRGAVSSNTAFFGGIPESSTEYWLYCEMYPSSLEIDGNFGVTTNTGTSVSTEERGDFTAGVRFYGDGTNLNLYAFTGGGASNDVLLTTGLTEDTWYGVWLNINNAENTYDVYLGDAGDAGSGGSQVGADIAFDGGSADLVSLLVSSYQFTRIDNIIQVDPASLIENLPADLYACSLADSDTMQLSINLNGKANAADYWPISCGNLAVGEWAHVAHSDAPDGTFAVTNLNLAGGDETNKVIYVKTTDDIEFIRIENNE